MTETLTILSERVDDIPLLLAQVARMGVQPLLDAPFPTHSNWQGLSLGWVTVIWLTHILRKRTIGCITWSRGRSNGSTRCVGAQANPSIRWMSAMPGWPSCCRR